jgi:hypothetical protein
MIKIIFIAGFPVQIDIGRLFFSLKGEQRYG